MGRSTSNMVLIQIVPFFFAMVSQSKAINMNTSGYLSISPNVSGNFLMFSTRSCLKNYLF